MVGDSVFIRFLKKPLRNIFHININIDKDYLVFLGYFIKRDFTIENNPIYKDFTIIGCKSLHFIYTWLRSLNEEKGKLFFV